MCLAHVGHRRYLLCSRLTILLSNPLWQKVCLLGEWWGPDRKKEVGYHICDNLLWTEEGWCFKTGFSMFFIQGHYCDSRPSNVSLPRPCLKGHYCPAGTASPEQHPCLRGTFNPRERARSLADCVLCAAGQYCPSVGLSEPAGAMSHLFLMYSFLAKFCFEHPTVL